MLKFAWAKEAAAKDLEKSAAHYVTVYKKPADGGWKVVEDITASGLPH